MRSLREGSQESKPWDCAGVNAQKKNKRKKKRGKEKGTRKKEEGRQKEEEERKKKEEDKMQNNRVLLEPNS